MIQYIALVVSFIAGLLLGLLIIDIKDTPSRVMWLIFAIGVAVILDMALSVVKVWR